MWAGYTSVWRRIDTNRTQDPYRASKRAWQAYRGTAQTRRKHTTVVTRVGKRMSGAFCFYTYRQHWLQQRGREPEAHFYNNTWLNDATTVIEDIQRDGKLSLALRVARLGLLAIVTCNQFSTYISE